MEGKNKIDKLIEGITLVLAGAVILLVLLGVFGNSGRVVSNFLLGVFGYAIFGYAIALLIAGILLLLRFKLNKRPAVIIGAVLVFISFISIFHALAAQGANIAGYGSYIKLCYVGHNTAAGALGAIFLYPIIKLSYIFTIVLFSLVAVGGVTLAVLTEFKRGRNGVAEPKIKRKREKPINVAENLTAGNLVDFSKVNSDITDVNTSRKSERAYRNINKDNYDVNTLEELYQEKENFRLNEEKFASNVAQSTTDKIPPPETAQAINILFNNSEYGEDKVGDKEYKELTLEEAAKVLYQPEVPKAVKKKKLDLDNIDIENYTVNGREKIIMENLKKRGEVNKVSDDRAPIINSETVRLNKNNDNFVNNIKAKDNIADICEPQADVSIKNYNNLADNGKMIFNQQNSGILPNQEVKPNYDKYPNLMREVEDLSAVNPEPLENFEKKIRKSIAPINDRIPDEYDISQAHERLERKRKERSDKGGEHVSPKRENADILDNVFEDIKSGIVVNKMESLFKSNVVDMRQQDNQMQERSVPREHTPYKAPPIELLNNRLENPSGEIEDFDDKIANLESTLSSFHISAKVNNIVRGPAFSRLELVMPAGVPVSRVSQRENDIAMCLEAQSIRMQIPIPGKNAIGIELPNKVRGTVGVRSIINSPEFNNSRAAVTCGLGKDVDGHIHVVDLATMPHLLVAGATGAGKSVCLNVMLVSILYHHTPEEVRLVLVDPKQVEFSAFYGLPHLLIPQSIYQKEHVINLLDYLVTEMDSRFTMITRANCKQLSDYNVYAKNNNLERMPYIVAVLDEVGDLMIQCKREIEERIMRLSGKARASGIILVIATQRPSVNVITGVIKANLPSRIAFAVSSFEDSKTILGQKGAENLLSRGDMLYKANGSGNRIDRIQGAFIDNDEVIAVCDYVRNNNTAYFDPDIAETVFRTKKVADDNSTDALGNNSGDPDIDATFVKCLLTCIEEGFASISLFQRKFRLGYNRASVYFYKMEEMGYISKEVVNNRRNVLLTKDEFDIIYGDFQLD